MSLENIPVDVRNPGQVLACLGLMEAAEVLHGPACGGFDPASGTFSLESASSAGMASIFDFLRRSQIRECECPGDDDRMARPICLAADDREIRVGHWADRSGRETFKLYAGNRSGFSIAQDMQSRLQRVMKDRGVAFSADPWNQLCPMGGSFNFDPRGAWNAMDAGYSPDAHHRPGGNVMASPAVELLAAIGLEHARPFVERRKVRYAAWPGLLPTSLTRAVLGTGLGLSGESRFSFILRLAGKNKIVGFAESEA